jgi:septal ring factor EnvC (AmiA/AmiB activator)
MKKRGGRKSFGTKEWEDAVYQHVSSHGEVEGAILEEYRELADDDDMSPAFCYLARMILDDETRHHRIFDDLAATMDILRRHGDEEPPIPSLTGFRAERHRLTAATDRLLRIEREDLRELKEFSKELKELRNVTLWGLLIELMIDDTKKHIKILEFIRDRAKDQPD